MLGFRCHFLTKSRTYSRTFRIIRGDRRAWRLAEQLDRLGHPADDPVLVINDWHLVGIGHHTDTDRELAVAHAERIREQLWGIKDVADHLRVPVQTLYQWRGRDYGPRGIRVGRHVRYRPEDVRAWVASLVHEVA
jgi:predicted DNA-binding transcriptional regulator AlpA